MATDNIYGYTGSLELPESLKNKSLKSSSGDLNSQINNKKEKIKSNQTNNMFGYDGNLVIPKELTDEYEPSAIEKFRYGTALETNTVGDLARWVETAWESIGEATWEEARQDVEKERLDNVYEDFSWARSGKYDNDLATWGGRTATLMLDPVYMIMPWGMAMRGATLTAKMARLAAMGSGVGAADMALRSKMRTGKVDWTSVGLGAGIGAAAGPLGYGIQKGGGAILSKAFPNLFKSVDEAKTVEGILRKNFENKYNLNTSQLNKVSEIAELPSIKKFFKDILKTENAANKWFMPKDKIVNELKKLINKDLSKLGGTSGTRKPSFTFDGKTYQVTNTSQKAINKIIDEIEHAAIVGGEKLNSKVITARHKHFVEVLRELEKRQSLTETVMRGLVSATARPIAGAGAGAVYGTLFTDTDQGFYMSVVAGASLGMTHKLLTAGKISGITVPRQKEIAGMLQQSYMDQFKRWVLVQTAHSLQSKLTARGPILDEFSAIFFNRPTDVANKTFWGRVADDQTRLMGAVDNVEGLTERGIASWIGGIEDALGKANSNLLDSAKLKLFQNQYLKVPRKLTAAEENILKVQDEALDIVRGASTSGKSAQAITMANGIKKWLSDFKKYYNDVGFTEKELLENYFPRKFNYDLIRDKKGNISKIFRDDVEDIYKTLLANPKSRLSKSQRKKSAKQLADDYIDSITTSHQDDIITLKQTGKIIRSEGELPLSKHITEQRHLQGSWEEVESKLKKYLVNDVRMVLSDITTNTVKSVEFARKFGTKAEGINGYFRRIFKQYQDNGFVDLERDGFFNNQHRTDIQAITDSVNAYFGRFGRKPATWEKNLFATLSTLANFAMMDKVTIANLGDLIQPFQNSRYSVSAFLGMRANVSSQMNIFHTKAMKAMLKDSFVTKDGGMTPLLIDGQAGSYLNLVGKTNEYFFKAVGLEGVTNMARRYAYNVGAVDAHLSSKAFLKELIKEVGPMKVNFEKLRLQGLNLKNIKNKSLLKELNHLIKNGTANVTDGNVTNLDEIIKFARTKKLKDALADADTASLIDRVGLFASNRDAIIPTVGNRLLFSQSRNPWVRLVGQFSSWAMAKTAQTNAMLRRIEDGNARQLIAMVGALTVYGGIKEIRDWAKYGEWNMYEEFRDEKARWFAKAAELSGQHLPWMSTLAANRLFGYQKYRPTELAPIESILKDWAEVVTSFGGMVFGQTSYDNFIREWYEALPAPTLRGIAQMIGIPFTDYKKDPNFNVDFKDIDTPKKKKGFFVQYNKGGVVEQTRKLFSEGDVAEQSFGDAFKIARNNRQELFTWKGNEYTTKQANETSEQYKKFLGVDKFSDRNYLVKKVENDPIDSKALASVTNNNIEVKEKPILKEENIIVPKEKPILEKENIIVPKKKPILEAKKDDGFSLISKAEASIVEVPSQEKNTIAKTFESDEYNNTKIVSAPVKLLAKSFWQNWFGKKEGDVFKTEDFDKKTLNVLQIAAKNALNDGRSYTHYTDYPLTKRGVSAEALVGEFKSLTGERYTAEYKKKLEDEVNKAYGTGPLAYAKIMYDFATDPVMKAIFSVGGFSIQKDKNNYFINETFDFNSANQTEGTVLKKIRKVLSNMDSAAVADGTGPAVYVNLGELKTKVALKMAKGDTPSVAWMRNYYFDGKGGYDTWMSFDEFITGPGKQLYLDSRKKSKGGVIRQKFWQGGNPHAGGYKSSSPSSVGGGSWSKSYNPGAGGVVTHSNIGGGNGGSSSNNNNNNNNTNKNNKSNTKTKRLTVQDTNRDDRRERKVKSKNVMEKFWDTLGTGDNTGLKGNKTIDVYNDDSWDDVDSFSVKAVEPKKTVGTEGWMKKTNVPLPNDTEEQAKNKLLDIADSKEIKGKVGYEIIGPTNKASAYLEGSQSLMGGNNLTGNIDFSNVKGWDVNASYNLNDSILSGSATKTFEPIGTIPAGHIRPYVGVTYNDGDVNPTAGIKINFKKGGLLDKNRG